MEFEQLYLAVRQKENRLYTNEQVRQLPNISPGNIHAKEWRIRKRSSLRIIQHLANKKRPLTILEVGCGNGWLSARISEIKEVRVTGIDINDTELLQAQRVFEDHHTLEFVSAGIYDLQKLGEKFDSIIFAASLQYFSDLSVLTVACSMLKEDGEIHIIDTMIYEDNSDAVARTNKYYDHLGFPKMRDYYFHHRFRELEKHYYKLMYDPRKLINKLLRKDPFPWILIKSKC